MLNLKPGLPLEIYVYWHPSQYIPEIFKSYTDSQLKTNNNFPQINWRMITFSKKVKVSVTVDLDEIWGCERLIKNFAG